MRRSLFFFILFLMGMCAEAQYTELPSYEKKKPWSTEVGIVGIGTSEKDVMISLTVSGAYNFNAETYLEYINPVNGATEKVFMTDSRRETGEYAMRFAKLGYHYLTLTFPPLPNGVNKINLISPKVKLWGISIRPVVIKTSPQTRRIAKNDLEIQTLVEQSSIDIAGIYESIDNGMTYAVIQKNDSIFVIYIKCNGNEMDNWKCGEVRGTLRPTSTKNIYKATWLLRNKEKHDAVITFDATSMTLSAKHPLTDEFSTIVYVKMGDGKNNKDGTVENGELWTGSGYSIGNGFIVTNNHVVDGAKSISIKGVKGDMNNGYIAEVVATDKANDIAVLRITDSRFNGFGTIPYSVSTRMADVGEDVFVLGYPLTQALGNEIKLANGIVSSRTGYQGDVSTYQMSAPVQPGNSGGPMFDSKGNVIGIVVAGVPGAENVGYAIKTSYLKILIESAGLNIKFPANNTISTLSLAEKVKRVKNFVFYIECSK